MMSLPRQEPRTNLVTHGPSDSLLLSLLACGQEIMTTHRWLRRLPDTSWHLCGTRLCSTHSASIQMKYSLRLLLSLRVLLLRCVASTRTAHQCMTSSTG